MYTGLYIKHSTVFWVTLIYEGLRAYKGYGYYKEKSFLQKYIDIISPPFMLPSTKKRKLEILFSGSRQAGQGRNTLFSGGRGGL